jgi:hypothetical protein
MATEAPPGNGVSTTLSGTITSSATTCSLTNAAAFTNAQYHCLITDGVNYEMVQATGLSGSTLTIVRGAENWAGANMSYGFNSGATITVVTSLQSVLNLINQGGITATNLSAAIGSTVNLPATTNTNVFNTASLAVGTWLVTAQIDLLTSAVSSGEYDMSIAGNSGVGTISGQSGSTFVDETATASRVTLYVSTIITVTTAGTFGVNLRNGSSSAATAEYTNAQGSSTTGYSAVRLA